MIETLSAFANTKGGRVLLGVTDEGKIAGISVGQESIQKWINQIKSNTAPSIIPDVEIRTLEGKSVIELEVGEFPIKPVSCRGRYYKRVNNSNHRLSLSELSDIHLKTINSSWDYYADHYHSVDDISEEKVFKFMDAVGIQDNLLTFLNKYEFLKEGKITYGCYLLFARNNVLISTIEAGRFASETTIKDSITIKKDLFSEIDEIIEFTYKHSNKAYIITGKPKREERWDYPMDAIREIVVNMIVHRNYQSSNDSIIKIFDDRIEFFNPGKLSGELTIEKIKTGKYKSFLRNKQIAGAFKEANIIEKYGTGIKRVIESFQAYGLEEPLFESFQDGFQVTVFKKKTDLKTGLRTGLKTDLKTETIENLIISLMKDHPKITIPELADRVGRGMTMTKKYIAELKTQKRISRIGPLKGGYWKVME